MDDRGDGNAENARGGCLTAWLFVPTWLIMWLWPGGRQGGGQDGPTRRTTEDAALCPGE